MITVKVTRIIQGDKTVQTHSFTKDEECQKFLEKLQEERLQKACQKGNIKFQKTLTQGLWAKDFSSVWIENYSNIKKARPYEDLRSKVAQHIEDLISVEIN